MNVRAALFGAVVGFVVATIPGCGTSPPSNPCGNGYCELNLNESLASCPADCLEDGGNRPVTDSGLTDGGGGGGGSGGAGGSGGSGGGDGGITCNASTCSGCCDPVSGNCVTTPTALLCGTNGGTCARCSFGQVCLGGSCEAPTCNNCRNGQGQCIGGPTNNAACGQGGAPCKACNTATEQCTGGQCIGTSTTCNTTNCANGCCDKGTCVPSPTSLACGKGAAACQACAPGQVCSPSGQCANTTPDGGLVVPGFDGGINLPGLDGGLFLPDGGINLPNLDGGLFGTCDAVSCATGCCAPIIGCMAGTDAFACGTGGKSCTVCFLSGKPTCDAATQKCK